MASSIVELVMWIDVLRLIQDRFHIIGKRIIHGPVGVIGDRPYEILASSAEPSWCLA